MGFVQTKLRADLNILWVLPIQRKNVPPVVVESFSTNSDLLTKEKVPKRKSSSNSITISKSFKQI
jgi:hypothetical protein